MAVIAFVLFAVLLVISIISVKKQDRAKAEAEKQRFELELQRKEQERASEIEKADAERKAREEEWLREYEHKAAAERELYEAIPVTAIQLSPVKRPFGKYQAVTFSNVTARTKKAADFVAIDTETTGLHSGNDRIIELAAVRFKDGVPSEAFHTYINPGKHIPESATAVNSITDEMVAGAPNIGFILDAFEAFVGTSDIVGHNLEFDLAFLFHAGMALQEAKRRFFDTLSISKKVLHKAKYAVSEYTGYKYIRSDVDFDVADYKLNTVAYYYDIANPDQHSALADAYVCGKMFLKLFDDRQAQLLAKREEHLSSDDAATF